MSIVWDVVVAGAGPGGATTAALLARAGVRVLLLDKQDFPRFHIGESLLPAAVTVLEELGIEAVPHIFVRKRGARFLCEGSGRQQGFDFAEALAGPPRHAWQVVRADFDALLAEHARRAGAELRHGVRVLEAGCHEQGVEVSTTHGRERARFFVDATGQGRLLARQQRSVQPFRGFGKAAVFTHFHALSAAAWQELGPDHDIRILVHAHGWAWAIPLAGGSLSVGLVSQERGLGPAHLEHLLATSPLLQRLTAGAERGETRCIGNFSFENTQPSGRRFACVGDAACFIDPVFSSGVSLAMQSASQTVRQLLPALLAGREAQPQLLAPLQATLGPGYATFIAMVHRFYNTRFVDHMIFAAPAEGALRAGVVSVLAGDVFRDDNPFARLLLTSRRAA